MLFMLVRKGAGKPKACRSRPSLVILAKEKPFLKGLLLI